MQNISDAAVRSDEIYDAVRRLRGEGFTRYHNRRYMQSDCANVFVGFVVYLVVFYCLPETVPPSTLLQMVLICLLALMPPVAMRINRDLYEKRREAMMYLHMLIHHVWASQMVTAAGINVRSLLRTDQHPLTYFLYFVVSSTVLWHGVHAVTYRVSRLWKLVLMQGSTILMLTGHEANHCRFAVKHHQIPSVGIFRTIHTSCEYFVSSISSIAAGTTMISESPYSAWSEGEELDGFYECTHFLLFLLFLVGLVLPGFSIAASERREWEQFINSDPEDISWSSGPPVQVIRGALVVLRSEQSSKQSKVRQKGPMAGFKYASLLASIVATWICVPFVPLSKVLYE